MNESLTWMFALAVGMLLGVFFFGGLWWTVRLGANSKWPALLFLGSMLLRTGIVLLGFYTIAGGHWETLLATLLGFIVARMFVMRLTRPVARVGKVITGVNHAP